MKRFWEKYAPYWHMCTAIVFAIFIAGTYWNRVDGYSGRIAALEATQGQQKSTLDRMDYNIQLIGRKIGLQPLEPSETERHD